MNRLLWALMVVSLGIHAALLSRIADLYRPQTLSVIEFTLQETAAPPARAIPRPRIRHAAPVVNDIKTVQAQAVHIPQFKLDPVTAPTVDAIAAPVRTPDTPSFSCPPIAAGTPPTLASPLAQASPLMTQQEFLNLLRLKIEQNKQYPESAKIRQIQGKAMVRFIIAKDGKVEAVEIVKSAGHASLDRAAVNAVKQASPFPPLPAHLFRSETPLQLEIPIVFELS